MPLGIRGNRVDWAERGIPLAETNDLGRSLAAPGCDVIVASSGGEAPATMPVGPGRQPSFAPEIRRAAGRTTRAAGMIRSPRPDEGALATGQAHLSAIGRGFLNNPRRVWPATEAPGVRCEGGNSSAFGATGASRRTPDR